MKILTLKVDEKLDKLTFKSWEKLWQKSDFANVWNSPYWFDICLKEFKQAGIIVSVYENDIQKLIFPLIKTKKFGINIFESPAAEISDKSSILFLEKDKSIFEFLFKGISNLGNIIISEIENSLLPKSLNIKKFTKLQPSVNYYLPFENDPYRFFSKKQLKKLKKIIDANKDKLSYVNYSGSDLSKINIACEICKKSDKKLVKGYRDIFSKSKSKLFLNKFIIDNPDKISLDLLYYEDKPISFYLGFVHGDTYYAFQTAYLPDYKILTPGKILHYLIIKRLFKEGYKEFDFGRGEGRFKSETTSCFRIQENLFLSKNILIKFWWFFITNICFYLINIKILYRSFCFIRKSINTLNLNLSISKGGKI